MSKTLDSSNRTKRKHNSDQQAVVMRRLCDIRPAPENDQLYRPVDPTDPKIVAMAEDMRVVGVLEPLVTDCDGWILSGHRRYVAAGLAGLETVPVRIDPTRRADDIDAFTVRLCEYNKDQRVKSLDEQFREAIVTSNPEEARAELLAYRREKSKGRQASLPFAEQRDQPPENLTRQARLA